MTQEIAEYLAESFDYRARKIRGQWLVWCDESDHVVEFERETIERAAIVLFCRNA